MAHTQEGYAYYATNPSSPSVRGFTHLPSYEFDFDHRSQSVRSGITHTLTDPLQPVYESPLVDDFDSYMFPESDSQSSPTEPSLPSEATTPTYLPSASDFDTMPNRTSSDASPKPEVDWAAVDSSHLFAPDGSRVDPTHLYTGYSTYVTLIFVPRQAVELCALVFAKLAHLLQQASSRLVFITAWTPEQATTFLSRFERVAPFPGSVVCDPDASLFGAFGLTRSPLRAFFAVSRVSAPMRQGVRNALSTMSYRAQNRDIASTPVSSKRLKVGAVVLTSLRGYMKKPNIVYAAEESSLTGVGCYMDVLPSCGVNEAFVPDIDVAQLYSRFNSMRTTSLKARYADDKEANRLGGNKSRGPEGGVTGGNKSRGSRKADRRNALKT